MFHKKTKLKLTDFECNLLWSGMNEFRNMLLSDGIPTEDVDELLMKIINQSERYLPTEKNKYDISPSGNILLLFYIVYSLKY